MSQEPTSFDKEALRELKEDPTGTQALNIAPDDVSLVAALAGFTAQSLNPIRFTDVSSKNSESVVNPKEVVGKLINTMRGKSGNDIPLKRTDKAIQVANKIPSQGGTNIEIVKDDSNQLELNLFKPVDMKDVYSELNSIKDSIAYIQNMQKKILDIIERIQDE